MGEILNNSGVLRLLHSLVLDVTPAIYPQVGVEGVHYPQLEKLFEDKETHLDLLEELSREDILAKSPYDKLFRCPKCHSLNLRPQLLCPKCKSPNFIEGDVVVHYLCSHVDFEVRFRAKHTSSLICPKCRKPLRQIGIDFGKPGSAFRCLGCEDFFHFPLERWICKHCDHGFPLNEASVEDLYSYHLNEAKRERIQKALSFITPLAGRLKEQGFEAECFRELEGESGTTHILDIYAQENGNHHKKIIIDVAERSGQPIPLDDLLKFLAAAFDLRRKTSQALFVALPSLDKEAGLFASKFKVEWIEGHTIKEATERVIAKLSSGGDGSEKSAD